MIKDAFYFAHDYEPVNDPKISAMMDDFGAAGYGYFWRITELLHSQGDHKLEMKPMIYKAIAKQMLTSAEQLVKFVTCCIDDYELFQTDGKFFWSERVNRNMSKREEISQKRSVAGKSGANAKQVQAIAKQNLAKEKKRKEIKDKGNSAAPNGQRVPEVQEYRGN